MRNIFDWKQEVIVRMINYTGETRTQREGTERVGVIYNAEHDCKVDMLIQLFNYVHVQLIYPLLP